MTWATVMRAYPASSTASTAAASRRLRWISVTFPRGSPFGPGRNRCGAGRVLYVTAISSRLLVLFDYKERYTCLNGRCHAPQPGEESGVRDRGRYPGSSIDGLKSRRVSH